MIHCITCMHACAPARARAAGKACFLAPSYSRQQHDGRLVAPREHGPDAGDDAAPVLCRRQHHKALPGCHREERWAVGGPQRGINCKEAFVYSTLGVRTAKMAPAPPKPPAHAPLALRRSGLVLWTPSHPCNAQQIVAAGNELGLDCKSRPVGKRRWTLFKHHTTCLYNERRREWPQKIARSGRTAR